MTGLIAWSLLKSLGLTLAVELSLAALLGIQKRKDYLLVALVNVLTNPVLGLILDFFWLLKQVLPPWYLIAGLELAAIAAEGWLYCGRLEFKKLHPFLLSLMLNGVSFLGGLMIT